MKTIGGRQFWGDVHYFQGFRIQQNIVTKHYRLLDAEDNRLAFGGLASCQDRLSTIKKKHNLSKMCGKAVILVHGIMRSSKSFGSLEDKFKEKNYLVFGFDYPSTRISIAESADYLHRCIQSLDGVEEINLVAHSMGGLVIRSMIMENMDPRLKRLVMMGVPNKGAIPADILKNNALFKTILGPAGQQLVTGEDGFIPNLPIPPFEFGIIAGGKEDNKGFNTLLPGDNDGTVCVKSTRLEGAADFFCAPVLHSFLMSNDACANAALHFLDTGRFRVDQPARPVLA